MKDVFEISGAIRSMRGDIPVYRVENEFASLEFSTYGAQVLSWTPKNQKNVLWLSEKAVFQHGKPIRGGIPICWPWFGPVKTPSHGPARVAEWTPIGMAASSNGMTVVEMVYETPDLLACLTLRFGKTLVIQLDTTNLTGDLYSVSEAMHAYFAVSDIANASVSGLDGRSFFNQLTQKREIQSGDVVFSSETDRIYDDCNDLIHLHDKGWNRTIVLERFNSNSCVVWNPWTEKAKRMEDFGDEEYKSMLCLETAHAARDARTLKASETLSFGMRVAIV